MCKSPLEGFEIEVNRDDVQVLAFVVRVSNVVSHSQRPILGPLCIFEISFWHIMFSPSFETFKGCGSQCGEV